MLAARAVIYWLAMLVVEAKQCKSVSYTYCCELGTPCDCTKGTTSAGQCKPEPWLSTSMDEKLVPLCK